MCLFAILVSFAEYLFNVLSPPPLFKSVVCLLIYFKSYSLDTTPLSDRFYRYAVLAMAYIFMFLTVAFA